MSDVDREAAAAIDALAWLACDGRPNPALLDILARHRTGAIKALSARLAVARKEALEQAAKVADDYAPRAWDIAAQHGQNGACASGRNYAAREIAQAIRALDTDGGGRDG